MAQLQINWFAVDLFHEAKSLRKSILNGEIKIDATDNKSKNIRLEYYRMALRYIGVDMEVVNNRLKSITDEYLTGEIKAKQTVLSARFQQFNYEIEASVRLSGLSLFEDFPTDTPSPSQYIEDNVSDEELYAN